MSINTKFIGREYPPVAYVIGREKIKEYARTVGDMNPLYHDPVAARKSQYGCIIAPPMFAVVFTRDVMFNMFADKELKIDMKRLVHGEQEFNFHKLAKENDTITTIGKIKSIFIKGNNDFIELQTESYNQNKELIVEGLWTFVIRG